MSVEFNIKYASDNDDIFLWHGSFNRCDIHSCGGGIFRFADVRSALEPPQAAREKRNESSRHEHKFLFCSFILDKVRMSDHFIRRQIVFTL